MPTVTPPVTPLSLPLAPCHASCSGPLPRPLWCPCHAPCRALVAHSSSYLFRVALRVISSEAGISGVRRKLHSSRAAHNRGQVNKPQWSWYILIIYKMLLSILDINRSGYGAVNPPKYASANRVYASGGGGHKSVEPSSWQAWYLLKLCLRMLALTAQKWTCVWLCLIVFDCVWLCLIVFDCVWLCLIVFDCVWLCLIVFDCVWLCLIVFDCVVCCVLRLVC